MPTNFKSYEAQSRLLAAVLASQPGLRLNFKAIAQHFGSDATPSAIEHRFRPIKKHVAAVRQAVAEGKDAKDLAPMIASGDKKDIHKYYGESTPQGLEFQFRAIKKDAKALKDAVDGGQSPLTAKVSSSSVSTPRKRRAPAASKDDASVAGSSSGGGGGSRKRVQVDKKPIIIDNDEDNASSVDYDLLDLTPTHSPKKRAGTIAVAASTSSTTDSVSGDATPAATAYYAQAPPRPAVLPQTPTPAASFVPDSTPALTVGNTPPEPEQDDDNVFILDTPSKSMPMKKLKLEPTTTTKIKRERYEFYDSFENYDEDDDAFPMPSFSRSFPSFSQSLRFDDGDI